MTTDYGSDVSTFIDGGLDPYGRTISGPRVVLEHVARAWIDPARGNVRRLIGAKQSITTLQALRSELRAIALEDERVLAAEVTLEVRAGPRIVVGGTLVLADGPFKFTLAVTDVTAEIINGDA